MHELPSGAPQTMNEAFAWIATLDNPSVDDLKIMVMVEAAGKALYESLASGVSNEAVRALLLRNGREELAHAHRVSRAIGKLTGVDYPVPAQEENPYLTAPLAARAVDAAVLSNLAEAEFGGEALYERWASHCPNDEAAALFRQNGRLQEAAALL
jgi:rubrerythrin